MHIQIGSRISKKFILLGNFSLAFVRTFLRIFTYTCTIMSCLLLVAAMFDPATFDYTIHPELTSHGLIKLAEFAAIIAVVFDLIYNIFFTIQEFSEYKREFKTVQYFLKIFIRKTFNFYY
jgi:hypothetical protein